MSRRLDIAGKKFGCLTPIEIVGISSQKSVWKCLCDCGKYITRIGTHLINKPPPKSCSHCNKGPFKGYGEIPKTHFDRIQKQAEERSIPFNIRIEDCWEQFLKQNKKCSLSGVELKFTFHRGECTASLDRINSNLAYEKDNISWVHKRLNVMKNKFSTEEFIYWCNLVINNNKKEQN